MAQHIDPDSFGFLVSDLSRMIRVEMDRRIAEAGIGVTPGEARTLMHVARAGSARQSVLAERIGVEAMTVSGYLDRLEARGLVTRSADPGDRRAKRVELTGKADAVLTEVVRIGREVREIVRAGLSAGEWEALIANLKTVRETLAGRRNGAQAAREGAAS